MARLPLRPVEPDVRLEEFPGGSAVLTCEMPGRNAAYLGLWVRVGSRHESDDEAGGSHFLEHLHFDGSASRTGMEIRRAINGCGGWMNAGTGEEYTIYLVAVPRDKFALGYEVMAEILAAPRLAAEDFERQKLIIGEEIGMYQDTPYLRVQLLARELLFPGHPLGRFGAGTKESVGAMTLKRLRAFRERSYCSGALVSVAAGGITHDEHRALFEEHLSELPEGPALQALPAPAPPSVAPTPAQRVVVEEKECDQAHVAIVSRALSRLDERRYAQALMNAALGGAVSSRLMEEVREKRGLAYSIGSDVTGFSDVGRFAVSAGVQPNRLVEALEVIAAELERMRCEDMDEEELGRTKEYVRGGLLLSLEDAERVMSWAGETYVSLGRVPTVAEVLDKFESVGPAAVREAAREALDSRTRCIAVVGPGCGAEAAARAAGLREATDGQG